MFQNWISSFGSCHSRGVLRMLDRIYLVALLKRIDLNCPSLYYMFTSGLNPDELILSLQYHPSSTSDRLILHVTFDGGIAN
jgi:hypothetical protein